MMRWRSLSRLKSKIVRAATTALCQEWTFHTSAYVAKIGMLYMDVPRCASPELIRFAAIYPASLLG